MVSTELALLQSNSGVSVDDRASDNSDVIYYSEDSSSDAESISLKESAPTPTGDRCFEDDIISGICVCGAHGRAHKRDCLSNSRNHYVGCTLILFPKDSSADSGKNGKNDDCATFKPPKASMSVGTRSTHLGKREKPGGVKLPPAKKPRPNFKVGDCVNLHDNKLGNVIYPRSLLCCANVW